MHTPPDTYAMPHWALPSMLLAGITGIAIGAAPHLVDLLAAAGG